MIEYVKQVVKFHMDISIHQTILTVLFQTIVYWCCFIYFSMFFFLILLNVKRKFDATFIKYQWIINASQKSSTLQLF